MARNHFTRYAYTTDLRGRTVELRNGDVVRIPEDATVEPRRIFKAYWWRGRLVLQTLSGELGGAYRSRRDIMKVIK